MRCNPGPGSGLVPSANTTTALVGGSMWRPTTSRILASSCGSTSAPATHAPQASPMTGLAPVIEHHYQDAEPTAQLQQGYRIVPHTTSQSTSDTRHKGLQEVSGMDFCLIAGPNTGDPFGALHQHVASDNRAPRSALARTTLVRRLGWNRKAPRRRQPTPDRRHCCTSVCRITQKAKTYRKVVEIM